MQMLILALRHIMLHHWFSQRISDLRHRRPALPPKLPQGALFLNATIIVLGDLGSAAKSWSSREEREFDSPTPGVRAKYPEPSRRET